VCGHDCVLLFGWLPGPIAGQEGVRLCRLPAFSYRMDERVVMLACIAS
jgi:hypothetical protein